MATKEASSHSRLLGGLLMWFAVLGGAVAWAAHEIAAWSTNELVCASGHEDVSGTPLRLVLGLMVVIPLAVAVASLATAGLALLRVNRARSATGADDPARRSLSRTSLMAAVGLGGNALFVAIIVFDGIGVLVFPPCQR